MVTVKPRVIGLGVPTVKVVVTAVFAVPDDVTRTQTDSLFRMVSFAVVKVPLHPIL